MSENINYITAIDDAIGKSGRILPNLLNGYKPVEGLVTLYEKYAGGFCIVYPLQKDNGTKDKCIRLWHKYPFNEGHVKQISEYFRQLKDSGYVIGYEYYNEGLLLDNGMKIPAVVMDWINGSTLMDYVKEHHSNPSSIRLLADSFYTLAKYMKMKGMAHGDLSADNILVKPDGNLILIDYDSFFVPNMSNSIRQTNDGTPGYQHRERGKAMYLKSNMDNFSQQVIYLALLAITSKPSLADESSMLISDKQLMFVATDFASDAAFTSSRAYKAITGINNSEVQSRLAELRKAVSENLENVKSITDFVCEKTDEEFNRLKEERAKALRKKIELKEKKENIPVSPGVTTPPGGTTRPTGNGYTVSTNTGSHTYTNPNPTYTPRTFGTGSAQQTMPWYKQWYVWMCAVAMAVAVAIGMYIFIPSGSTDNSKSDSTEEILSAASEAIARMEGNYTLRETNGGMLVNGIRTAAIKKSSDSQARILVSSEYGPEFYDFTLTLDGKIQSEQLGTGEITYNERLDKITITFKQGERVCEFTK